MSEFSDEPVPVAAIGTGYVSKGDDLPRIDGFAKVTGAARYAAEYLADDMTFGVVVNSTIAKGRIVALHVEAAKAVPGVLDVLSHLNRPRIRKLDLFYKDMTAPPGIAVQAVRKRSCPL
jgi:xanthine dehydrogenase YagR molybdenum-binding subunit